MIDVRDATAADRRTVLLLLAEMARFYAERRDPLVLAEGAVALTAPAGRAGPFCLLAFNEGTPAGLVSLSRFFPAFDFTWGLLLKDVFVVSAARGFGVGRALMTAAAAFAARGGYSRIDWTTDAGNDRARAVYAALGVPPADKLFYRIEGDTLATAASGTWPDRIDRA